MSLITDFKAVAGWIAQRAQCSIPREGAAIGWKNHEGVLVAGVLYEDFTGPSITATIAIDAPPSKTFMRAIFAYPFEQLRVKQVWAMVESTNEKALEFDRRCGFEKRAVLKNYFDGADAIIMACTPLTCRWIKVNHGKEDKDSSGA